MRSVELRREEVNVPCAPKKDQCVLGDDISAVIFGVDGVVIDSAPGVRGGVEDGGFGPVPALVTRRRHEEKKFFKVFP